MATAKTVKRTPKPPRTIQIAIAALGNFRRILFGRFESEGAD
jgi:hypothetical protein